MGVALSTLPFHPNTGLQAIGFTSRGPVWPVMGGSEDATDGDVAAAAAAAAGQQQSNGQSEQGQQSAGADKGFPDNTPVKDMTETQQLAYYRYQNRQTDNKLGAFKGVTPQQVQEMQQRIDQFETAQLSADQKAIKDAEKAARTAADAEWRPKMQRSELRAIASEVLKGDQLNAWLAGMNPAAFADENGEISHEKVMGHLTAAFGGSQDQQQQSANNGRQQAPAWGQGSGGGGTPSRPGDAGKAAAAQRFGTTKTP